jgi:hypothetical protein
MERRYKRRNANHFFVLSFTSESMTMESISSSISACTRHIPSWNIWCVIRRLSLPHGSVWQSPLALRGSIIWLVTRSEFRNDFSRTIRRRSSICLIGKRESCECVASTDGKQKNEWWNSENNFSCVTNQNNPEDETWSDTFTVWCQPVFFFSNFNFPPLLLLF